VNWLLRLVVANVRSVPVANKPEKKKSWWSKLVSKLGIGGRKDYKQSGSQASTSGRVGDGMMDMTINAVRNRNQATANAANAVK
jgi:hypothetical protein